MPNEDLFEDLKQFITATVSQSEERLRSEMATKEDLKSVEQRLSQKIDDVQAAIADTLTQVTDALDTTTQVRDLERRVTRLEHRAA